MATINVGGRTVEVPDNLDPSSPATQRTALRSPPAAAPRPTWQPTNPNVARGAPSAEAAAWQASRAPQSVAAAPAKPAGLRGATGGVTGAFRSVGGTAKSLLTHPAAIAGAGIAGAVEGFQTDTEDYARRFGLEGTQPGLLRDVGVRALGVGSDVLNNLTLRGLGAASDFAAENGIGRGWNPSAPGAAPAPTTQAESPTPTGTQAAAPTLAATPLSGTAGPNPPPTPTPGDITRTVDANGRVTYTGGNVGPGARIFQNGQLRSPSLSTFSGSSGGLSAPPVGAPSAPEPAVAPQVLHSGNSWEARNNLRNLAVSANSITNNGGAWDQRRRGDVSAARQAYAAAVETDNKLRQSEPGVALEAGKSANSLRGQVFDARSRLAGDVYSAKSRLAGDVYSANSKAASAAAAAGSKAAGEQNALDIENAKRAKEQFSVYSADGKLDEAATQRAVLAVDKIIPGYSTMGEQARKQNAGDATAIANIFNRSRAQGELGLGQAIFGNDNPELDSMPNFKGGTLKRSGLTGGLPGGAGISGYYVQMPDGREVALGKDLSERELAMIRHNTATGGWIPPKEEK